MQVYVGLFRHGIDIANDSRGTTGSDGVAGSS